MALIDISPLISERIANWPGDIPFKRNLQMSHSNGDHLELSSIETSLHLGSHADSSLHFEKDESGIESVDLNAYYGNCRVVEVKGESGSRIYPEDLNLEIRNKAQLPRILLKTASFPNPDNFNEDFRSLSPELIEFLSQKGTKLIGIDTPSVDPFSDKELLSHHALFKYGMRHLEGLVLMNVKPDKYKLIAFPLKIEGADASPVRAVLESF